MGVRAEVGGVPDGPDGGHPGDHVDPVGPGRSRPRERPDADAEGNEVRPYNMCAYSVVECGC